MPSVSMWEIWQRAETGPICPERKYVLHRYHKRMVEIAKEYGIYQDPQNVVPTDDTLIDDVFKAGVRLLLDVGVLCTNTERVIEFEEWEVREAIRNAPKEITVGEGRDIVKVFPRKLKDNRPSPVLSRFNGLTSSEEIAFKVYLSMAKEPLVDMINTQACAKTIDGMQVKVGTPSELYYEIRNATLGREAVRRAGRPGLPLWRGVGASEMADIASSNPEHGYRRTDVGNLALMPGLLTNYMMMNKAAHYLEYGCHTYSQGGGGYDQGPETSVVGSMAAHIAHLALYKASIPWSRAGGQTKEDRKLARMRITGLTSRHSMWGTLLIGAAASRNGIMQHGPGTTLIAGPCTEMILYELANATIGSNAVGILIGQGMGHGTRDEDYVTGLEGRFAGEVNRATVGIKREEANDLINIILEKYEPKLIEGIREEGKTFQECYDQDTISPSKEYIEIYERVKSELQDIGLDFE